MPFNVADFRARISENDVQRSSKFLVMFNMPSGLYQSTRSAQNVITTRELSYYAESVTLPPFGVQTTQAMRYGYGAYEKRATGLNFGDCSITFISDEWAYNWTLFYDWLNLIYNFRMQSGISSQTGDSNVGGFTSPQTMLYEPYQLSYRYEYLTDVTIVAFAQTGRELYRMVLRECYPTMVGSIEMDWGEGGRNQYVHLPIAFTFTDLYLEQMIDPLFPASNPHPRTGL